MEPRRCAAEFRLPGWPPGLRRVAGRDLCGHRPPGAVALHRVRSTLPGSRGPGDAQPARAGHWSGRQRGRRPALFPD
ncbi:hypothetical protein RY27_15025, partial [Litorilinea aerophila]